MTQQTSGQDQTFASAKAKVAPLPVIHDNSPNRTIALSGSTLKEVDTAQIKSDVGAPGACNDSCCNLSGLEESCWIHWARAVAGS